ncbi:MAG: aminoglycoside phosphotransferase family protein [Candidatus Nanopelagicales bacterium]
MGSPSGRRVTVVLCDPAGTWLGALPPVDLPSPWYPNAEDVIESVRKQAGVDVTVLRLLDADQPPSHRGGGKVIVLAQVQPGQPTTRRLEPVPHVAKSARADHRLRAAYARPGGPQADLAWAEGVLARRGTPRIGAPRQIRTWNLSCIWVLPTAQGPVWLKSVPPFFGHEGAMIEMLASVTDAVPALLGRDDGRVLLGDVPGVDQCDAPARVLRQMLQVLVGMQVALIGRVDSVLATGAFDWRPPRFDDLAADVVDRTADQLDMRTRAALTRILAGLPKRQAALAACGIPDTLVHGDFHPGNVHGGTDGLVILDWADSGVGHPLLDQSVFLERVPQADQPLLRAFWSALWRAVIPDCEPDRAAGLLAPIAALRQAVIYRFFLDRIEPAEHLYHAADPAVWLAKAALTATNAAE